MRCVITYFQNKRIALPYIFGKYCLPEMKKHFPGEIQLFHIFHNIHVKDPRLASTRDYTEQDLSKVRSFLPQYKHANIISHSELIPDMYTLPSFRIGMKVSILAKADLHLWLEDDAIVMDTFDWLKTYKDEDVLLYRNTISDRMANCAFMITSNSYDRKALRALRHFKRDNKEYKNSSQIENFFWTKAKSHVLLDSDKAIRHHPYVPRVDKEHIKEWLMRKIPNIEQQDIDLLDNDYKSY
jgi:hypothetical protein